MTYRGEPAVIHTFGGGAANGTNSSTTITYAATGTKDASLEVSSGSLSTSTICSATILSNLTASCDVDPESIFVNGTTTRTASASGGSGGYTYSWYNGVTGTGQTKTTSYNTAGTTTASVTVTDSGGRTANVDCADVRVGDMPTLTVDIDPEVDGNEITWTGGVSGGTGPYEYGWIGTDGLLGTGLPITKTYTATGTKIATLFATSSEGYTGFDMKQVVIDLLPVNGVCVSPSASLVNSTTTFSVNSESGGDGDYEYNWLGDGVTGKIGKQIEVQYISTGTKNVSVKISSSGLDATKTCQNLVVYSPNDILTCKVEPISTSSVFINKQLHFTSVYNSGFWGTGNYKWYDNLHKDLGALSTSTDFFGIFTTTGKKEILLEVTNDKDQTVLCNLNFSAVLGSTSVGEN